MGLFIDWLRSLGRGALEDGVAALNRGDYKSAVAVFTGIIRHNRRYVDAYVYRSFAFSQLGDFNRAISDCNRAITLQPENAGAYGNRGLAYEGMGELARAIADYDRAIGLDSTLRPAYINRGRARGLNNDHAGAIADFTKVLSLTPGFAEVLYNRAVGYYHTSQYAMAAEDLTTALQLNMEDVNNALSLPRDRVIAMRDRAFRNFRFEQLKQRLALPEPDSAGRPVAEDKVAELAGKLLNSLQRVQSYRSIFIVRDLGSTDVKPYDFETIQWRIELASPGAVHIEQDTRLENFPAGAGDEWITIGGKNFEVLGLVGAFSVDAPHPGEIEKLTSLDNYFEFLKTAPVPKTVREAGNDRLLEWSFTADAWLWRRPLAELRSRLANSLSHTVALVRRNGHEPFFLDQPAGLPRRLPRRPVDLRSGDHMELSAIPVISAGDPRSIIKDHQLLLIRNGFSCQMVFWIDSKEYLLVKVQFDLAGNLQDGQPVRLRLEQVFGDYNADIVIREPGPDELLLGRGGKGPR